MSMIYMVEETINRNLKYTDWNPYVHSVNDDLNIITSLIPFCYDLGKGNVKKLAINLQALYHSRETFISLPQVLKKIDAIIDQFHKPAFARDYAEKKEDALYFEYKCIKTLLNCFSLIVKQFSKNKLIPEVDITKVMKLDEDYIGAVV